MVPGRPGVEGFLLCYSGPENRLGARQGFARCAFEAFGCEVTQDGDDEGIVFLDWLPTAEEAEVIRDKLRIPKNRAMGEAGLERLRLFRPSTVSFDANTSLQTRSAPSNRLRRVRPGWDSQTARRRISGDLRAAARRPRD